MKVINKNIYRNVKNKIKFLFGNKITDKRFFNPKNLTMQNNNK